MPAIIIPLLKSGKPRDQSTSYRPISLLSPASKVLEKLMSLHHDSSTPTSPSSCFCLQSVLPPPPPPPPPPPLRTMAMAVDTLKAFNTVNHTPLSLLNSTLSSDDIRCLFIYIGGRTASCIHSRVESARVIVHQGVHQGSILSPLLFNYYVSTYTDAAQFSTSYADKFTAFISDQKEEQAHFSLMRHAEDVASWSLNKNHQVLTSKSTDTFFIPEFKQSHLHPNAPLNGTTLPLGRNP